MKRVGGISNSDQIIDKKVKYFYDIMNYMLSNQGDKTIHSHDNHLIILERILFRLQNFDIKPSTKKIIKRYLEKSTFFDLDNDLISKKESIKVLIKELRHDWNSIDYKISSELDKFCVKIKLLISKLNGEEGLDGKEFFEHSLSKLISYLKCSCDLEKHKKEINYYSHLISTEYLRIGFASSEVTKPNGR